MKLEIFVVRDKRAFLRADTITNIQALRIRTYMKHNKPLSI